MYVNTNYEYYVLSFLNCSNKHTYIYIYIVDSRVFYHINYVGAIIELNGLCKTSCGLFFNINYRFRFRGNITHKTQSLEASACVYLHCLQVILVGY